MRTRCAGDLRFWIIASDPAQVRFEILKAHRCELLTLGCCVIGQRLSA
jgi:hypothetical protein